jgi:peptidoglycan/xylan/chitin deacetylase (PgdA/CDA1 family)
LVIIAPPDRYWGIGNKLLKSMALAVIAAAVHLSAGAAAVRAATVPIHSYQGAVPVLCYHGIREGVDPTSDPYSVTRAEFTRQMEMLAGDGFHAISIAQYARFAAGDITGLPERPILITFDDGRIDSYQGADQILARFGMRATMFVITANANVSKPGYLGWSQLVGMSASGRWDLQEHAHAGHVLIPTGPGETGPYYANLLYQDSKRETFTAFKRRVSVDILTGRRLMASHIAGFEPLAFAPPYDNYGQLRTNYAPIPAWENAWLRRTFKVVFVQDRRVYNLPGNPIGQRYGVHATTTADALHRWLIQALPRSAWTAPAVALPPPRIPALARPSRPSLRSLRVWRRHLVLVFMPTGSARLGVTRRRAGRSRRVRVAVSRGGRLRDLRLRPGTVYVYRAVAVDPAGNRSRVLRLRVRTPRR